MKLNKNKLTQDEKVKMMKMFASFHRIIKNYLKMKKLEKQHNISKSS